MKDGKMSILGLVFCSILMLVLCSCQGTSEYQKTTTGHRGGGSVISTKKADGKTIETLKTEWQNEKLYATGTAPVIEKYDNMGRNKALAKKGAKTDAIRNMADLICSVKVSATTIMIDYMTTDIVQTDMNAWVGDIKVITERYVKEDNAYECMIEVPKLKLVDLLEKHYYK